jgi:hypothetical protein
MDPAFSYALIFAAGTGFGRDTPSNREQRRRSQRCAGIVLIAVAGILAATR